MPRRKTGLWRILALLMASMMLLAACGDDDDGGTTATTAADGGKEKTNVALAFVGPLTGPNKALGINIRNGIKVALAEANEASTKYEYEMKEFDTQGKGTEATTLKDKFIDDAEILGIVGPTFSGETKAVLPDLEAEKLVMISPSATGAALPTEVPNGTVFHRVIPDDDVQGVGVTKYVTDILKAKTAVYIHDKSEYGQGLSDGTQKLLEKANVKTAGTGSLTPGDETSIGAAVTVVSGAKADVVFYGGYYSDAGQFKKQLDAENVTSTFVSGDGTLDVGFIESAGAGPAEGSHLTCPCKLATEDTGGALGAFAKKYKEINDGANAATYSTEGYDAANIFIEGIEAGNNTREKLLAYVEALDSYEGLSKTVEFEENGNVKAGDVYAYQVKGGKIVELGTIDELLKGT